jgi:CheY-like chemotaxis protein
MRKRILVAESADAVRQAVESVLRQNGYDVIAVSAAGKAAEVLQFSRPDLIVAGGDLTDEGHRPFYEIVQNNPKTSSLPLLVIEPADKSSVSLPPEVVITRPIDPKDFLQRVGIFLGQAINTPKPSVANPTNAASTDDSFLDAALGLDRLDVTSSEDMDRTGVVKVPMSKNATGKVAAYDRTGEDDTMGDSRKVESLIIHDEATDIRPQNTQPPKKSEGPGTGKIEIMPDQYGISDPEAFQQKPERPTHDYDWFVSAMRDEVASVESKSPTATPTSGPKPPSPVTDSQKLHVTETASIIDPITSAVTPLSVAQPGTGAKRSQTEGVEKFIDEFKREIELLRAREPEPSDMPVSGPTPAPAGGMTWEEEIEALTADQVRLFTREFSARLAERVAERIVARIDADKLLLLIKDEIVSAARARSAGKR